MERQSFRGRTSSGGNNRPSFGNRPARSFGNHSPSTGSRGPSRGNFGRPGGPSRGGSSRFQGGRGGGRKYSKFLDLNKFINKAVSIEEKEASFIPEHNFSDFAIEEKLKKAIEKKGYILPTPIQDRVIPHILQGKDVVGIANTGTGKTAAFLIPLINKVILEQDETVIIIVPTRELAIQIDQELKGFGMALGVFSAVCVGGTSIVPQLKALRYRNQFIIGTPGRLKDLVDRRAIDLGKVKTVVLDEADRMLDMGFIDDMRFLMAKMPAERHTLFFSATLSKDIEKLINDFLRNPVSISVKTRDTSKNIDQDIVRLKPGQDKFKALEDLLRGKGFNRVLIFGRTKHGVSKLAISLEKSGFKAESIHGDKNHAQRQRALNQFKNGEVDILVATDVAARGLDIVGVSHVINYDLPATYEDYIHRIGRTGRAQAKGQALTFIE